MTPLAVNVLQAILKDLLASLLGTYTLLSGTTQPAIYVVNNAMTDPPRDWKVAGLECLVHKHPRSAPVAAFSSVVDKRDWIVELVQHDQNSSTETAKELIFQKFLRCKVQSFLHQTEETLEQITLRIPSENLLQAID